MEDLLLDSISEKLLAIDQKTTEILKTTAETTRSIDQIRSRLSSLESKEKMTIREIPPPQLVESKVNRSFWSLAPKNNLRHILLPLLIALATMVAVSVALAAGLQTSLLLPYLQISSPKKLISPSSQKLGKEKPGHKQRKKDKRAKLLADTLPNF